MRVPLTLTVTRPVRLRALLIGCDVAGFDMLQTRAAGLLLPEAHGRDRLRQRALPPPRASAGNQCLHLHVETPGKICVHHDVNEKHASVIRVQTYIDVQTTHENDWKRLMLTCRHTWITYIYEICSLCPCNSEKYCYMLLYM